VTDPTITIAGLEARINSLRSAVQHSNRTAAERMTMFVEASSNADRLTAERDALAAQLAEVRAELAKAPKVCAIHSYEHGPGPCMTCGAWPPGTRELIAACRTRIAGLEQAADERSAEVARLTALGAPPTSTPAARPVFAGVSVEELADLFVSGIPGAVADGSTRSGLRAVLARLEVSLVAPVDPEAVARRVINGSPTDRQIERCRDALTAAGIPVTPEVGK